MILLQIHFRKCMLIKSCGYDPMFMFTNSLNRDNQGTGNTNILALTRQFLKSSWRWLEICMLLKDCIFLIFLVQYLQIDMLLGWIIWNWRWFPNSTWCNKLIMTWCGMHKWPTCQLQFLAFAILRHTRKKLIAL